MSDTDKLKEMYRSLIHHVTYVTLAGKQHPEGSPMRQFERSLILVQDALLCKLGSNYAEFEPDIEAAGALDVSTSQEITDRTIRDCVVANSASGLIKLMMDNIALFEN